MSRRSFRQPARPRAGSKLRSRETTIAVPISIAAGQQVRGPGASRCRSGKAVAAFGVSCPTRRRRQENRMKLHRSRLRSTFAAAALALAARSAAGSGSITVGTRGPPATGSGGRKTTPTGTGAVPTSSASGTTATVMKVPLGGGVQTLPGASRSTRRASTGRTTVTAW